MPETETVVVPVEVAPEITAAVRRELEATSGDVDRARVRSALYDRLEVRSEFVDDDGRRVVGELVNALE